MRKAIITISRIISIILPILSSALSASASSSWLWPVAGHREITSYYGWRTLFGQRDFHRGIDIRATTGTPVRAAKDGVVKTYEDKSYGKYIIIDHGNKESTLYAHLSRFTSGINGKRVKQGDTIGLVGSTGNSTGPHLHFEIRKNNVAIDSNKSSISYIQSVPKPAPTPTPTPVPQPVQTPPASNPQTSAPSATPPSESPPKSETTSSQPSNSSGQWSEWNSWSSTVQTASATRQVESRTLYRYGRFSCDGCNWRSPFWNISCHKCGKYIREASWNTSWREEKTSQLNRQSSISSHHWRVTISGSTWFAERSGQQTRLQYRFRDLK